MLATTVRTSEQVVAWHRNGCPDFDSAEWSAIMSRLTIGNVVPIRPTAKSSVAPAA